MSSASKNTWHKIAESIAEINFSVSGLAELEINGKKLCVGLYKNEVFACAQKCPHAGGILAEGYFDAVGNIVCSLHRYKYNRKTGRNVSGEGYFLKTFPIEIRDNGVFIRIDDTSLVDTGK